MIGAFKAQLFGSDGIAAPLRHVTFRRIWLASVLSNLGILIRSAPARPCRSRTPFASWPRQRRPPGLKSRAKRHQYA